MSWLGRRARHARMLYRPGIIVFAIVGMLGVILFGPASHVASEVADRMVSHSAQAPLSQTAAENAQPFGGVAAIGALFSETSGKLGKHFCTASVINSPHGDLAITAAHCVSGTIAPGTVAFVPGYASGATPYGVWQVTRVYTNAAWQASQDPDDDIAFIQLAKATDGVPIENVTGAEQLGTGWPAHTLVQVIGYPDTGSQPVWCANWTQSFSSTQLEFDCGGYTTGTSGGPFLANVSGPASGGVAGQGTVIGIIGGYQQGGDTPSVSYSVAFGDEVAGLLRTAEAGG
jgi:V8-like Glu-specific endopeptidase